MKRLFAVCAVLFAALTLSAPAAFAQARGSHDYAARAVAARGVFRGGEVRGDFRGEVRGNEWSVGYRDYRGYDRGYRTWDRGWSWNIYIGTGCGYYGCGGGGCGYYGCGGGGGCGYYGCGGDGCGYYGCGGGCNYGCGNYMPNRVTIVVNEVVQTQYCDYYGCRIVPQTVRVRVIAYWDPAAGAYWYVDNYGQRVYVNY